MLCLDFTWFHMYLENYAYRDKIVKKEQKKAF
jgi:hypothetical protein